jgi:hypothetical protein
LPAPALAEHPRTSFVHVPYPPPAALAETVPPPPEREGVVWVDGEWTFRGRSYAWRRGGWFIPPSLNARFAPMREHYTSDGRLFLAPGTWYGSAGEALLLPKPVLPARTPPNNLTPEFQTGR